MTTHSPITRRLGLALFALTAAIASACGAGDEPPSTAAPTQSSEKASEAEPQPPQAPVRDIAVLDSPTLLDLDTAFEPMTDRPVLVTPAATITVEAIAHPAVLPARAVELTVDEAASASEQPMRYYRPADGQELTAWMVSIEPAEGIAPDVNGVEEPIDATTELALDVAGRLMPITSDQEDGTATIDCDEVPCDVAPGRHVLLASTSSSASDVALSATTAGQTQTLDLSTGRAVSDVSQVANERDGLISVSTTWPQTTHTVRTEEQLETEIGESMSDLTNGGATYTYGGTIRDAYLSPFDAEQGWAPADQAWLVVPIADDPARTNGMWRADIDPAATWTLTIDDHILTNTTDGTSNVAVFLVDADITHATFTYQPTGTLSIPHHDASYPLIAEPLTATIAIQP